MQFPIPNARLPISSSREAPKFNGHAYELVRFLTDIRTLQHRLQVPDQEMITYMPTYVTPTHESYFRSIAAHMPGATLDEYFLALVNAYPGARVEDRYTAADLDLIVARYSTLGANWTLHYLGEYSREFSTVAEVLTAGSLITELVARRRYLEGLGAQLGTAVQYRLGQMDMYRPTTVGYTLSEARHEAEFLLRAGAQLNPAIGYPGAIQQAGVGYAAHTFVPPPAFMGPAFGAAAPAPVPAYHTPIMPIAPITAVAPAAVASPTTPVQTATAPTLAPAYLTTAQVEEVARAMLRLNIRDGAPQRPQFQQQQPQFQRQWQQQQGPPMQRPPLDCLFCGNPNHFIKDCPEVDGYVARGLCQRMGGRVVGMDGGRITGLGRLIRERLDNLALSQAHGRVGTMGMYEGRERQDEEEEDEEVAAYQLERIDQLAALMVDAETRRASLVLSVTEREKRMKDRESKKARFNDDPVTRTSGSGPSMSEKAKGKAPEVARAGERTMGAGEGRMPPARKATGASEPRQDAVGAPPKEVPQFRFTTPIEVPGSAGRMLKRVLDESTITITARELIQVCPDVRKGMKDLTTTRRVGFGGTAEGAAALERAEVFYNDLPSEPMTERDVEEWMVGRESMALRQLEGRINDDVSAVCILDQGSQFVAMRRDVWEKVGVALSKAKKWVLEAANGTTAETIGMIDYLNITFGDIRVPLKVQVVETAPFEILLGRPFFALTQCTTQDFRDGEQHVTLTDPYTNRAFTIPTKERTKASRTGSFVNQGF